MNTTYTQGLPAEFGSFFSYAIWIFLAYQCKLCIFAHAHAHAAAAQKCPVLYLSLLTHNMYT